MITLDDITQELSRLESHITAITNLQEDAFMTCLANKLIVEQGDEELLANPSFHQQAESWLKIAHHCADLIPLLIAHRSICLQAQAAIAPKH